MPRNITAMPSLVHAHAQGARAEPLPDACNNPKAFRSTPKRGDALLFYRCVSVTTSGRRPDMTVSVSMLDDGNLDIYSMHAGCPVGQGDKWAANWWWVLLLRTPQHA
jgi:hypothetical protein